LKKKRYIATKIFAYISPICREAALVQIYMKFCMRVHLADVINRANHFISIRSGVLILWGIEFLAFP